MPDVVRHPETQLSKTTWIPGQARNDIIIKTTIFIIVTQPPPPE